MDKVLMFLTAIAAVAILLQWYVFVSLRRHLFQRHEPMRRIVAYPVLVGLGILNLVALRWGLHSDLLPADSWGREIASIAFFSYLGAVLFLSLFFGVQGSISRTISVFAQVLDYARTLRRGKMLSQMAPPTAAQSPGCTMCSESGAVTVRHSPNRPNSSNGGVCCNAARALSNRDGVPSPGRRAFLKWSASTGVVTAVALMGTGLAEAYQRPIIEEFEVFHPALRGLDRPLRLIQITDFHFGLFMGSDELSALVDILNSIEGEAVFLTGDIYHSPLSPVEKSIPALRKLLPRPMGNLAVMGNHDFYTGEMISVQGLTQSGVELLRDQWRTFRYGTAIIHLGGMDDPRSNWLWGEKFPNFQRMASACPESDGFRLLLSHRPGVLPFAAQSGMDLVLSGHIHGGQVILPVPGTGRGLSIASIASEYTHGWYRDGNARLYLNRGVGLTFVPWRVNCPPEITVFHLMPAADDQYRVRKRGSGLV
jgi:uncharacterized protein